jgi:hypothetical protein
MKDHYIITDDPELAQLGKHYRRLFDVVTQVETAMEAVRSAKSERINNGMKPEAEDKLTLFFMREAIYEAAHIRLKDEVRPIRPLLEPLYQECQRLRSLFKAESERARLFYAHKLDRCDSIPVDLAVRIQANVVFAEDLYDTASGYYASTMARYPGSSGIRGAFERAATEPREWILKTNGHGFDFRFDGADGNPPPAPFMTEKEANAKGWQWELISDTIGGCALLYNVYTRREKAVRDPKTVDGAVV